MIKSKQELLKKIDQRKATPFQKKVWETLLEIPSGQTRSYRWIAEKIGHPRSMRAVGNAVGKNPLAPEVPCHRVVRENGQLGGYSARGGVKTKIRLLKTYIPH